ncbi:MAG TPA: hypothetical protein VMH49_03155 [Thermoplasmata archaeon]|nr:hypothetical protein [Thermoplasmata archaeon]
MPYVGERDVRLFYDASCGPCRMLARASEQLSRHRLEAIPLDAPAAEPELRHLSAELRYGYAHLGSRSGLRTGDAIAVPLLGLTLGPTWERLARRVPLLGRSLEGLYRRLGRARRTHGCAAPGPH